MLSFQFEDTCIVIEYGWGPAGRCMAERTICTQLPTMGILPGMAGVTFHWCTLVNIVYVTGNTCGFGVLAEQREPKSLVREICWFEKCEWGIRSTVVRMAVPASHDITVLL